MLLHHFLAALAYRTQNALRDAPPDFASFRAAAKVRTPHELIQHMDSVLGYARTFFVGGRYRAPVIPDCRAAVEHFHGMLADVGRHLESGTELKDITAERLLQGPFSDAMTHAGQLAMLRRLAGSPVPPENFVFANMSAANLSALTNRFPRCQIRSGQSDREAFVQRAFTSGLKRSASRAAAGRRVRTGMRYDKKTETTNWHLHFAAGCRAL